MNINEKQLQRQYYIAKGNGFIEAARAAATEKWSLPLLLAISSREANLDPRYLTIAGDHGNGYGITQVDRRSFYDWVQTGKWKNAFECFAKTVEVLDDTERTVIRASKGAQIKATTLRGVTYYTPPKPIANQADMLNIVLAGYNSGIWGYYHYSKNRNPDTGTTGIDYGQDVQGRAKMFKELLDEEVAPKLPVEIPPPVHQDHTKVSEDKPLPVTESSLLERFIMKSKFNWKSLIPIALAIFAPQLAALSTKTGVTIAPAMLFPYMPAMLFAFSDVLLFVQPVFLLIGSFLADGSFTRGVADWKTNIVGVLGSVFSLAAGFGIIFSPSLKQNIIALAALLVGYLSKQPDDAAAEA